METILRIVGVIIAIGLIMNWMEDSDSDTSDSGPSKTEIKIEEMTKQFSSMSIRATDFQRSFYYDMTDIKRENWEKSNKDKIHLVRNKVNEVLKTRDKLTDSGGYNKYSVQLMDSIEDGINKSFSKPGYQNIGFQCNSVYAYDQKQKNAIENLSVGKTIEILASGIELGSFWHEADFCVIKGIH